MGDKSRREQTLFITFRTHIFDLVVWSATVEEYLWDFFYLFDLMRFYFSVHSSEPWVFKHKSVFTYNIMYMCSRLHFLCAYVGISFISVFVFVLSAQFHFSFLYTKIAISSTKCQGGHKRLVRVLCKMYVWHGFVL